MDFHNSYRNQGYSEAKVRRLSRGEVAASVLEAAGGSPGKRFPRLCIFLSFTIILCLISWIPVISNRKQENFPFVWPSNQTRSTRLLISPDRETTIIQPKVCHGGPVPYLLVIVCSAVENYEAREAIRASWAKDQQTMKNVGVVFLVGQLFNVTSYPRLEEEADRHGDIIQEDFTDSYANLTIKSLMLLKWFTLNCDNPNKSNSVEFVLKTDDDMYVNLAKLYEVVQANKKPNLLLGSLICNAVPIKDPHNKWFVPRYMFSEKKFPNYLSGTGYLMQRTTISQLYTAALETPVFHLEDIYITGILARKVGIRPADNIGFSLARRKFNSCLFKQTITTHHIKLNEMKAIYKKIQSSKNATCPVIKAKLLREYGPNRCKWP